MGGWRRRVAGVVLVGGVLAALLQTDAAQAAPLLDPNGCFVVPTVDADGMLEVDGTVGGASARLYPFYEWIHDGNGGARYVHDPARLYLEIRARQAATCPREIGWGGVVSDPTYVSVSVEVTSARAIRIHGMDMMVTNQRPTFLNGATGFSLEVVDGELEFDTSQFIDESPGPPIPALTMRALTATSIDMTGDGVADITLPRPETVPLEINGTSRADVLDLAALDARTCADGGFGVLLGAGDDAVTMPQAVPDAADGGACTQPIYLGTGDDRFTGGPGNDHVRDERGGALHASFGAGDDTLEGEFGYRGHADSWVIPPGTRRSVIDAGHGHDEIELPTGHNIIRLGPGDDAAKTGNGDDRVWGGAGNDTIRTGGGDDLLVGEAGDDVLTDENYDSLPSRFWGDDVLVGGPGRDTIAAGFGTNRVVGGPGNDALSAHRGPATVIAGTGTNSIDVRNTSARIIGGPHVDWIETSSFRGGTIQSGAGADRLWIRVRDDAAARRTRFSCGTGMDRAVYAPRPNASCERMFACRFGPSEWGACGRLPWGRVSTYYWEIPHERIGAKDAGPWQHRPADQ